MIIGPGHAGGLSRFLLTVVWLPIIVVSPYVGDAPVAHPWAAAGAAAVASAGWLILVLRPRDRLWLSQPVGVLATAIGGTTMVAAVGGWSVPVAFCFLAVASGGGRLPRAASVAVFLGVASALAILLEPQSGLVGVVLVTLMLVMALVAGIGRRDTALQAEQRELALAAATRAQEEHIRAAALAERARIARDVHDALAHSLSALAVQLQGARLMVLRDGAPADTVAQIERAQRLATEGIAEARRAVSALRTDPATLADGLGDLVEAHPSAELVLEGTAPDSLDAAERETVLRVAREALTNTRKHAPDAPVVVTLRHDAEGTTLIVRDRSGTRPAVRDSDGYGLVGMAERAALIGAEWGAGPTEDGWQVRLRIPR
ncbi:sensor histidine kinase [Pseudonocardia spinosispora]|uniref:sensor histidine kinase n=1 Tax=Pseudonocardia spinosispora TaxID=103441 RepID=UPI0003F8B87A|nr:histidine kinase [Pseudonocardia spinosispora]